MAEQKLMIIEQEDENSLKRGIPRIFLYEEINNEEVNSFANARNFNVPSSWNYYWFRYYDEKNWDGGWTRTITNNHQQCDFVDILENKTWKLSKELHAKRALDADNVIYEDEEKSAWTTKEDVSGIEVEWEFKNWR